VSEAFLRQLNIIMQCDPKKCAKKECPNYYEQEDKCLWENVVSAFEITMKEKFKDRNKEE
jgi:hypothetical protein